MAFAVIRATNLCFRGSRVHWRSGTSIDDGAASLRLMFHWLKFFRDLIDLICDLLCGVTMMINLSITHMTIMQNY